MVTVPIDMLPAMRRSAMLSIGTDGEDLLRFAIFCRTYVPANHADYL
jgi:hypothetical protein